jgi:DNA polymerase-1
VIGTLGERRPSIQGYTTYMVTPDKDFGQLVTERIIMYKPGRGGEPPEKARVRRRSANAGDWSAPNK